MNESIRRFLRTSVGPVRKALGIEVVTSRLDILDARLQRLDEDLSGAGGVSERGLDGATRFVHLLLPDGGTYQLAVGRDRGDAYVQHVASGNAHDPAWRAIVNWVRPGDVFFDLGANIGLLTIPAALRGAQVHAFELLQDNGRLLAAAAERNGLGNISIVLGAVRDEPGIVGIGGHSAWGTVVRESTISVAAIAIDDYVSWAGIGRVDLMKIDVEGSEKWALRGARRTIARDHPDIVIESNVLTCGESGYSYRELLHTLAEAGYDLYRLFGNRLCPCDFSMPQEVVFADYVASTRRRDDVQARSGMAVAPMTVDEVLDSIVSQSRENDFHKAYVVATSEKLPLTITAHARVAPLLDQWAHLREQPYYATLRTGLA